MSARVFVDTNILIYAFDADAGSKHETAQNLLDQLWTDRRGVLSTQVLQEFYINSTRKMLRPLTKPSARAAVSSYSPWCVVNTNKEIARAFRIEDEYRIGFWDALIVAAAVKAGASAILSEDLNAGQLISGIQIQNPFIAAS